MPPTSTRPDARHGLRVTAPHGYYISDETCRRGEIRVHPRMVDALRADGHREGSTAAHPHGDQPRRRPSERACSVTAWPTLPDGRYAVLRTHSADGTSYGGFQWPTEIGGIATAPDWDANPDVRCGNGLHGLIWGCGDAGLLMVDGAWLVVAVDPADIANPLDDDCMPDKIRFRSAEILHIGDTVSATAWIVANGGHGLPVVHSTATAGYSGTATAGDYGTATAGEDGVLSITFYDESTRKYRRRIGEVDGVTLLPNVAYRLNALGEFTAVDS